MLEKKYKIPGPGQHDTLFGAYLPSSVVGDVVVLVMVPVAVVAAPCELLSSSQCL
jgi:hypothetical protein